jgi:hypothetical protein
MVGIVLQGIDPSQGLSLPVQENKNTEERQKSVCAPSGIPTHDHSVQVEELLHALDNAMFGISVRNIKSRGRNEFTQDISIFCSAFDVPVKSI